MTFQMLLKDQDLLKFGQKHNYRTISCSELIYKRGILIRINFNCLMRFNQVIHFTRLILTGVKFMQWTKPAFTDLRIGFEVTMYFEAR